MMDLLSEESREAREYLATMRTLTSVLPAKALEDLRTQVIGTSLAPMALRRSLEVSLSEKGLFNAEVNAVLTLGAVVALTNKMRREVDGKPLSAVELMNRLETHGFLTDGEWGFINGPGAARVPPRRFRSMEAVNDQYVKTMKGDFAKADLERFDRAVQTLRRIKRDDFSRFRKPFCLASVMIDGRLTFCVTTMEAIHDLWMPYMRAAFDLDNCSPYGSLHCDGVFNYVEGMVTCHAGGIMKSNTGRSSYRAIWFLSVFAPSEDTNALLLGPLMLEIYAILFGCPYYCNPLSFDLTSSAPPATRKLGEVSGIPRVLLPCRKHIAKAIEEQVTKIEHNNGEASSITAVRAIIMALLGHPIKNPRNAATVVVAVEYTGGVLRSPGSPFELKVAIAQTEPRATEEPAVQRVPLQRSRWCPQGPLQYSQRPSLRKLSACGAGRRRSQQHSGGDEQSSAQCPAYFFNLVCTQVHRIIDGASHAIQVIVYRGLLTMVSSC